MNTSDLKAELSVKMIELERAIDMGMPYHELKRIYLEIKELQFQVIVADVDKQDTIRSTIDDFIIE